MYTNNSMSNNNGNKFYRPATWESICFNDPEKAMVLSNYFEKIGWMPKRNSVPTVNLTYGIISPVVTHINYPGYFDYTSEYVAMSNSCKRGERVNLHRNSNHLAIDNCRFAYAADVPVAILKEIIANTTINDHPLYQYQKIVENRKAMEEAVSIKKENESLKKQLADLKKSVENLYNMTTK